MEPHILSALPLSCVLHTSHQELSAACLQEAFRSLMFDELDFESQEWQALSPDAQDLLQKLLVKEPAQRITAQEALQHR